MICRSMLVNSSLYLTCSKCFLKDYLVYIKIYSSVCILKSNTHIHTYRHKHICPSTVLFRNMLNSNTFLQYSLGLTRITGCWHAITTKHQFSLKNIYRNLNLFQVYQYFVNTFTAQQKTNRMYKIADFHSFLHRLQYLIIVLYFFPLMVFIYCSLNTIAMMTYHYTRKNFYHHHKYYQV